MKIKLNTNFEPYFIPVDLNRRMQYKGRDYTARQLRAFVERNAPQQQERSKFIRGINYDGMDPHDPRDLHFSSDSQDGSQRYQLKLRFFDFANLVPRTKKEVINLLNETDVGIYCTCPSFLYWGAAYKADQMGYGIVSEPRAPREPNKAKKDAFYACKHAQAVLRAMPFWWPKVMRDYINYYREQSEKLMKQELSATTDTLEREEIIKENKEGWK